MVSRTIAGATSGLVMSTLLVAGSTTTAEAYRPWGSTAAKNQVIKRSCHYYPYRYVVDPPTDEWAAEIFLTGPQGRRHRERGDRLRLRPCPGQALLAALPGLGDLRALQDADEDHLAARLRPARGLGQAVVLPTAAPMTRRSPRPTHVGLVAALCAALLTLTVPTASSAPTSASSAEPVRAAGVKPWGRTRARNQVLKPGCRSYRYTYRVTPPSDDWMAEIFLVGPKKGGIASATLFSDSERARGPGRGGCAATP